MLRAKKKAEKNIVNHKNYNIEVLLKSKKQLKTGSAIFIDRLMTIVGTSAATVRKWFLGVGMLMFVIMPMVLMFFLKYPNKTASMKENLAFVFGIEASQGAVCPFSPEMFSFSDTVPYEVTLRFDDYIKMSVTHGLIDGFYSENMLEGMAVRLTVRHCKTQKILEDVVANKCKVWWGYEGRTNDLACVACTIGAFSPDQASWRYSDPLKVQVKLLHPPEWNKVHKDISARLVVEEGYPFK